MPVKRWKRVRPYAACLAVVAGFIAISFVTANLPSPITRWMDFIVTLSVDVETRSIQLGLGAGQRARWHLPAGLYALEGATGGPESCTSRGAPPSCRGGTLLEAHGPADVRVEILADGRMLLELSPEVPSASSVRVLNADGRELLHGSEGLAFEAATAGERILLPLIVDRATLGAPFYESMPPFDPLASAPPPMLLDGRVRIFAARASDPARYPVLDERLERGDVAVLASAQDATGADSRMGPIRGFITIAASSEADAQPAIRAVLHSSASDDARASPYPRLLVRHFGATQEHVFAVTAWQIVSRYPHAQELWVSFVSFGVLFGFVVQVIDAVGASRKGR